LRIKALPAREGEQALDQRDTSFGRLHGVL
jgi:hypothetical protein